jgi:putative sterol carrier protein
MSLEALRQMFLEAFEKAKHKIGDEIRSWNRVFQFILDDGTEFYLVLSGGEMRVEEGRHPSPVATLQTDRETLEKILRGELDAMAAFMRGKLRITGNVIETVKLRRIVEAAKG